SILRETEQKTAIHTLNQSEPSSLIVGSVHMSKSGVEETSVLWCFFNLFGVLIPIDQVRPATTSIQPSTPNTFDPDVSRLALVQPYHHP
ncbi:TPA: hypothetical protein ACXGI6_005048, partial [Escherichia coli]